MCTHIHTCTQIAHIHTPHLLLQFSQSQPRLTFPKLPFPNTRMNSKLSMPNLLEELTPIPFPSLEPSFPCRLNVDLEMSFCKEKECRNSKHKAGMDRDNFPAVSHLSRHPSRGEISPGQMFSFFDLKPPSTSPLYARPAVWRMCRNKDASDLGWSLVSSTMASPRAVNSRRAT